jgi:hypothetical protein
MNPPTPRCRSRQPPAYSYRVAVVGCRPIGGHSAAHPSRPYVRPATLFASGATIDVDEALELRRKIQTLEDEVTVAREFPPKAETVGLPVVLTPEDIERLIPPFTASWIRQKCRRRESTSSAGREAGSD